MTKLKKGTAIITGAVILAMAGAAQAETRFAVQDAGGADKMVVTEKGFVGIGNTAPSAAVQTKGNSIESTQVLSHYIGTDPMASGGYLSYRNNLNGSTPILPKKGDRIGYNLFGSLASDGTPRNAAGLVGYAEADWTSTSTPAYFLFEVAAPGSTSRTERMRINSSGNVGVGTAAPTQKLEVNGAIRLNTTAVRPTTCDVTTRGVMWLSQGGTGKADALEVCLKDANGNYSWAKVTPY